MADNEHPYQPGAMLYDAIMGAFRSSGRTFEGWVIANGIKQATARSAAFGQAKGPKGRALVARIIEGAGPDVVRAGYLARLNSHVEDMGGKIEWPQSPTGRAAR